MADGWPSPTDPHLICPECGCVRFNIDNLYAHRIQYHGVDPSKVYADTYQWQAPREPQSHEEASE